MNPILFLLVATVVCTAAERRRQIPISPPGPGNNNNQAPQPPPPNQIPQGPPGSGQEPQGPAPGQHGSPLQCMNGTTNLPREHEIAAREQHNFYRSKHQSPPLRLNYTLNALAQQCADYYAAKGTLDSTCPTKDSAGENQYGTWYQTKVPSCSSLANSATTLWYNAIEEYDFKQPGFSAKTGSFTQLVWKGSRGLGVGCAAKNGFAVFIALYSPAGNVLALGSDPSYFFRQNVLPPKKASRNDQEIHLSTAIVSPSV